MGGGQESSAHHSAKKVEEVLYAPDSNELSTALNLSEY